MIFSTFFLSSLATLALATPIVEVLDRQNSNGVNIARRDDLSTMVVLGKTIIDYGCSASIRHTLNLAIDNLCYDGDCEGGSTFSRKVLWTKGILLPREIDIKVQIDGSWAKKEARDMFKLAVQATVNPKTAVPKKVLFGDLLGDEGERGECKMSRFPNFIQITNFDGGNDKDHIKIYVSMESGEGEY
jgi:hypothetical protein